MTQHYTMNAPEMYPIQTLAWRKKWRAAKGNMPEGYWLEAYSSLLASWNRIEYLGKDEPV